jgi:hypothetical protein
MTTDVQSMFGIRPKSCECNAPFACAMTLWWPSVYWAHLKGRKGRLTEDSGELKELTQAGDIARVTKILMANDDLCNTFCLILGRTETLQHIHGDIATLKLERHPRFIDVVLSSTNVVKHAGEEVGFKKCFELGEVSLRDGSTLKMKSVAQTTDKDDLLTIVVSPHTMIVCFRGQLLFCVGLRLLRQFRIGQVQVVHRKLCRFTPVNICQEFGLRSGDRRPSMNGCFAVLRAFGHVCFPLEK